MIPTHITVRIISSIRPNDLSKPYTYFNHIEDIAEGDIVVVEVGSGYRLAKVDEIDPPQPTKDRATKWIVDKVDDTKYRALTALDPPPPNPTEELYKAAHRALYQHQVNSSKKGSTP